MVSSRGWEERVGGGEEKEEEGKEEGEGAVVVGTSFNRPMRVPQDVAGTPPDYGPVSHAVSYTWS